MNWTNGQIRNHLMTESERSLGSIYNQDTNRMKLFISAYRQEQKDKIARNSRIIAIRIDVDSDDEDPTHLQVYYDAKRKWNEVLSPGKRNEWNNCAERFNSLPREGAFEELPDELADLFLGQVLHQNRIMRLCCYC